MQIVTALQSQNQMILKMLDRFDGKLQDKVSEQVRERFEEERKRE